MFSNIGKKIKTYSKVVAWCGIIASVLLGLGVIVAGIFGKNAHIANSIGLIVGGIVIIILGLLVSWVGAFFTYGFGEMIERVQSIDNKLTSPNRPEE